MRKTDPESKTSPTTRLSSWALARSWPNGFSMTTRRQAPGGSVGQAVLLELLARRREEPRRDGQVEGVVAAGAAGLVELGDRRRAAGRRPRRRRSRPATNRMPSASCFQTSSRNGVRACSLTESWTIWAKSWSAQSRRAKPTRLKPGRQQAAVGEVVDRRHELLARQVAGDAEDDQPAGSGDAREPPVARVAQRVARARRRARQACFGAAAASWSRTVASERLPGVLELLDALDLEHLEDVVDVDPDRGESVERRLRGAARSR